MKEPLRAKIEKASKAQGISINKEIVERLERSFRDQEALYREFGDKSLYMTMRWFALTLDEAQQITEKPWKKDEETFGIAANALWTMLRKGLRKGLPAPPRLRYDPFADRMGKMVGEKLFKIGTRERKQE